MSNNGNHEIREFKPCTFGDGGFYHADGADRVVCTCGWESAPVRCDKKTLIELWKAHRDDP